MTRTPLVAANWKMHKTAGEAEAFVAALLPRLSSAGADVALCPPFTALAAVVDSARGSALQVLAQNVHEAEAGAYTGMPFDHDTINHSAGEYVRDGVTTNGIESVFAVMKRGLHGVYQHMYACYWQCVIN